MGMGAVNPMSVTECSSSGLNPNVSKLIFPAFIQPLADFQIKIKMNSLKVFFASDIKHLSYLPENLHEAGKIDFFRSQ